MSIKVAKFGGSSLANAAQFRRVKDILLSDCERKYTVPSAPGRRFKDDDKITDLLYRCFRLAQEGKSIDECFAKIEQRYQEIITGLNLDLDLTGEFEEAKGRIIHDANPDYAASRGEYFNGIILAKYLGWDFIDAAEVIRFDKHGRFAADWTNDILSSRLKHHEHAVIPGFYGSFPDGSVKTFSRGGSDITGAIVARGSASDLYENWTDVSGLLSCDPRIVENPQVIDFISYAELRELAYMGASVLHESAIFPVKAAGIPINIRNTNAPQDPGTMIQPSAGYRQDRPVTGIAGRKHFSTILIEKDQMNETVGFGMHALEVLYHHGIQMEHIPTGIDTMSIVVPTHQLNPHRNEVLSLMRERLQANVTIHDEMSMIAVVGRGMVRQRGMAGRVFTALGNARVNVNLIDQGSGEFNIIIGVDTEDFEIAMQTLYNEFFR